jgi:hypothetical protein
MLQMTLVPFVVTTHYSHGLYRKLRNISIPVDLQIKLFDSADIVVWLCNMGFWKKWYY